MTAFETQETIRLNMLKNIPPYILLRSEKKPVGLVAGLVVAVLAAERWLKIGWDFMIGGVLLWGGICVHMNLAKDSPSIWLPFESGIF